MRTFVSALSILAIASIASAEFKLQYSRPPAQLGVNISFYQPNSKATRDAFGGSWLGIAPAFGPLQNSQGGTKIGTELMFLTGKRSVNGITNRINMYNVGLQAKISQRSSYGSTGGLKPYAGAGIGLAYVDLDDNVNNVSKTKLTSTTTAFIGVTFGDNLMLEARYRWLPKISGYDLSGRQLSIGFRF